MKILGRLGNKSLVDFESKWSAVECVERIVAEFAGELGNFPARNVGKIGDD